MKRRRRSVTPADAAVSPAVDERAVKLIDAISAALGRLNLDWPVVVSITGVTGDGVDSSSAINPGNTIENPASLGKKAEVREVVARLCAAHFIGGQKAATATASFHRIRERSFIASLERLLERADGDE